MSGSAIQGVLVDRDETLYSREDAFWNWLAAEAEAAGAGFDRERVAALDGGGDTPRRRAERRSRARLCLQRLRDDGSACPGVTTASYTSPLCEGSRCEASAAALAGAWGPAARSASRFGTPEGLKHEHGRRGTPSCARGNP